jgi:hypothetical protein
MSNCLRRAFAPGLSALVLSLMLGGCSTSSLSDMTLTPNLSNFEWNPYSQASTHTLAPRLTSAPATAADYVNADGSCAGATDEAVPAAVALQQTECTVVRILGVPERVEIGTNERGDRATKLVYSRGDRPGLYHFAAGKLKLIERIAEPAPPPRQQRQPAKPRRTVS